MVFIHQGITHIIYKKNLLKSLYFNKIWETRINPLNRILNNININILP